MSIEKLSDDSKTNNEQIPFTQICNKVILGIKNGDAFLVWSYLQSKTGNWKVIKQNIKNMYGFGDVKIKQIFSYLNRCGLIKYVQPKCAKGTFAPVQINVLSGVNFDKTQAYIESAPVGQKTAPAVNRTNGNDELLNKEDTKERNKRNTESYSASDDARAPNDDAFENYWKINPVKKNKIRAKRIWDKKKLYKIETLICEDVRKRLQHDSQWQDKQFIPHPSTYLFNELWNDEVTVASSPPPKSSGKSSSFDAYQADLKKQRGVIYEHGAISESRG